MTKGRSKSGGKSGKSARGAQAQGYAPAKLKAASGVGLTPGLALGAVAVMAAVGLVAVLGTGGRLPRAAAAAGHGAAAKMARLGFRIEQVDVEGASPQAKIDVLRAAAIAHQAPILDLDLDGLRRNVEQVGWVKSAKVVRLLPDTVVISIDERRPLAVWQHGGRMRVIDAAGHPIPEADPMRYAELPLVVGEGANGTADHILALLRSRPRLMQQLEALVRVDDRRWDIRLNDGGLIQLPAGGEESALIQLDQLDQKARILELGFARIDLRDPEMVAVRPREGQGAEAPAPAVRGA
jgi:cell division protein FtsQ